MANITRVERIAVQSADGTHTYVTNDGELLLKLRRGEVLQSGSMMGAVVVCLRVEDQEVHEVVLDAYQHLGSPVDVLDVAINQLTTAREALTRHVTTKRPSQPVVTYSGQSQAEPNQEGPPGGPPLPSQGPRTSLKQTLTGRPERSER